MTTTATSQPHRTRRVRGVLLSTLVGGVIASVVNALVALVALAAGADPSTQGLTPPAYITFTIVGVLVGAIGWMLIGRARSAGRILAVLVPVVVLVSLIPDIALALGATNSGGVTAAVALGIMHVVTAAVAVPVYRVFLPLAKRPQASA